MFVKQPNGTLDNAVTNPPSNSLWIGNISEDVTEQRLLFEFEQHGTVDSIRLLHNCAFVNFFSVEEAARALHFLQGKQIGQLNLRINFGKNRPAFDTPVDEGYGYTKAHSYEEASMAYNNFHTPSGHPDRIAMSSWNGTSSPVMNHHENYPPRAQQDTGLWNPSFQSRAETHPVQYSMNQWSPSYERNRSLSATEQYRRQQP